jgi:hypothetical protein
MTQPKTLADQTSNKVEATPHARPFRLPFNDWERGVIVHALSELRDRWSRDDDCHDAVKRLDELSSAILVHCRARSRNFASDRVRSLAK